MNLLISLQLFLICYLNQFLALTPNERKEFLDLHNHLRRSVVPTASNMQELEYNEDIEKTVYEFLESCKFEHRMRDNYGENGRLATDSNITNTLMSWFQERTFFNILADGDQRCSKENSKQEFLNEVQCGHYKMMVKGDLKSFGCGYKFCEKVHGMSEEFANSYITYCFYNSGQKDQPYEIGKPCSDCSMAYQFCKDELCVPKKRYVDKTSRTCEVKCKNCADYFDSKNSCLCDCPDGTEGNSCKGIPNNVDKTCTPCGVLGQTCYNGVENLVNGNCNCKCPPEFQGDYCEIRKDQHAASYYFIIDGINWRYNMMVPVSIVKFKNSFKEFQSAIANNLNEYCKEKHDTNFECKPILENPIISDNVLLIPGFPKMLENGSIAIRMFININVLNNGEKQGNYVQPTILHHIWTSKSEELDKFIESIRNVISFDSQLRNQLFFDSPEFQNLLADQINFIPQLETTEATTANFTENKEYQSTIIEPVTTDFKKNFISTSNNIVTNNPKNSNTTPGIVTVTKNPNYKTTFTNNKEYQSTNKENNITISEKSLVSTSNTEIISNGTYLSSNTIISTTFSTANIPKTTEKSANANRNILKGFILLPILYICKIL